MEVAWSGDGGLAEARWRGGADEACSLLLAEFIGRRALNRGGAGRRTGARGKGGTARFRFAHASFRLLFVGGLKPAPAVSEPREPTRMDGDDADVETGWTGRNTSGVAVVLG